MEGTDGELVVAAKAGEAGAFRELVERHGGRVFQLAYRITGNEQDAEDAVQESFLRAYRQLGRFDGNSSFGTWLYRIGANCALQQRLGLALTEKQLQARREAEKAAAPQIVADYQSQKDRATKQGIIDAYQKNSAALIAIAGVETDPYLKRKIVEHLIDLNTPEAREYLLEILK